MQSQRSESSSSEEEDSGRKPPFPAEHKVARTRLAKARRSGDEVLEGTALVEMGELKLRSAKYARALQRAEAAMEIFPQAAGKAESVRLIVRIHLAQHNILEAYKLLEKIVAFQRTPRDPKAVAILKLTWAEVLLLLERPEQALREGNTALEDFSALADEAWEAVADQIIARVSLQLGKTRHVRRGLQLAEKALKFFKGISDAGEEAATLLLISQLHLAQQEYEDAHLFAKVSADLSRSQGAVSREAAAQQQMASVMLAQGADPEAAGSFAKQAVTKCRKNGDMLGEISAHQVVASAYQAEGLVNLALEALNEALAMARKLGLRHLISTLLEAIVKVYDPEGALDVMREEEELARRSGDTQRELLALRRVALQMVLLERFQEAVQTAEEAVELARAAGDRRSEAMAMQLLGEVNKSCGQPEESLDCLLHARTLFQEAGDVSGEASVLELVVQVHEELKHDTKAQQFLEERQKLYHEAGWHEREAHTLMAMAKILIRNRGAIRAVEKAREAIALYGELDDEGRAFTAGAMLELAEIKSSNIRYVREAPEDMRRAQELYRQINDAAGQARALKAMASLHREKENDVQAIKTLNEAREICRKAGDKREEAQAALEVSNFRMDQIQKVFERQMEPDRNMIQAAIDATLETVPLFQAIGDTQQQASSLLLLAGLYVDIDEGELAQPFAEEALQLGVREKITHLEANALLGVAQAHLNLHEGEQAKKCALGARELFEQMGDEDGVDRATIVVEQVKSCPKEPKVRKKKAASKPLAAAPVQQDEVIPRSTSGRTREKGRFSALMEMHDTELKAEKEAEEKQQRREELLTRPSAKNSLPNQEQRRLDLLNSSKTPSGGQGEDGQVELRLSDVLQHVRPDWKEKDVKSVQEKFGLIGICTPQDLYEHLQSGGVNGINGRLKKAGQKQLRNDTLAALFGTLDEFYCGQNFG